MISYRTDKRQMAKNTGLLYIRSLFNLFLSLYTSRLVLQALGVDDYGIYNAVGGFVSMFWMVTGALNGAITRFLTYEMGRPENGKLKQVFSLALTLLLSLGVIVILFAETFGIWFLQHRMTIPEGRETAALWVFQTAIFVSVTSLVSAPFNSAIVAHEKFGIYAFLNIGETVLLFMLALFLKYGNPATDMLIIYALARSLITLTILVITTCYSHRHFEESRFRLSWDRALSKQLFGFTGWSLLGSFASMFSGQGVNVALNIFCGPAVNAARGLAFTVTNSIGIFVNNFTSVLVPQITKSYAAEDHQYFQSLVFKGSKLTFFIMLLFVIPLSVEVDFLLALWLKDVPEYMPVFTRFALLISSIGSFDAILGQAQRASGIIRNYQIIISVLLVFDFVASYFALRTGFSPVSVYIVGVIFICARVINTTIISSRTLHLPVRDILKKIYLRDLIVAVCSCVVPILVVFLLPAGWLRLITVVLLSIISTVLFSLLLGLSFEERTSFFQEAKKVLQNYKTRK